LGKLVKTDAESGNFCTLTLYIMTLGGGVHVISLGRYRSFRWSKIALFVFVILSRSITPMIHYLRLTRSLKKHP